MSAAAPSFSVQKARKSRLPVRKPLASYIRCDDHSSLHIKPLFGYCYFLIVYLATERAFCLTELFNFSCLLLRRPVIFWLNTHIHVLARSSQITLENLIDSLALRDDHGRRQMREWR